MNPGFANIPPSAPFLGPFPSPFPAAYEFQTGLAPPPGTFAQLQTQEYLRQIAAGPRTTYWDYNHRNDHFFNGVIDQAKWQILDNLTVRNIFGLAWRADTGSLGQPPITIDVDGGDLPLVDDRAPVVPGTTNLFDPKYAWTGGWPARTITEELQLQGKLFDNRLVWQAGAFGDWAGNRAYTPATNVWVVTMPQNPADPTNGPAGLACTLTVGPAECTSSLTKHTETDYAIYGQGTFAILDTLHFTGGVRHSWSSRSVTSALTGTDFIIFHGFPQAIPVMGRTPLAGTETTQSTPEEQRDTYNLALDWQATDKLLLYVTNRTGYKPGGINQNTPVGDINRQFGPEDLFDVEVGVKLDWSIGGVRSRTNFAYYHDNYNNIQTSSIIPGTASTITVNAAKAVIQGVEVENTTHFSEWFDLSGWFAYLDAHYVNFNQSFGCNATSEYWYPECSSQTGPFALSPGAARRQVVVNNATGTVQFIDLNAGGSPVATLATFPGIPTPFANAAKYTFSLQPTVHLDPWLHQDLSITANIQYKSREMIPTLLFPGLTLAAPSPGSTTPACGPACLPARVTADMHLDWNHVMGSRLRLSAIVTNITNETYNVSNASGFTIIGAFENIYSEPRMFYLELTYPLGG
jgi:outer membrane receptor protein involved in Fe transport